MAVEVINGTSTVRSPESIPSQLIRTAHSIRAKALSIRLSYSMARIRIRIRIGDSVASFSAAFVAALGRPNWYKHHRLAATWPKRVHVHLANPQLRCANRNRQDNRLLAFLAAASVPFFNLLCVCLL